MAYARLKDEINNNAKLLALSDAAHRMYTCGISYANKELTDGFLPEHIIHTFGVRAHNKAKVVTELCSVLVPGKGPLWHRVTGGFQIHDYLEHNDDRVTILAKRERSADRVERFRTRLSKGSGSDPRNASGNAFCNALHPPISPPHVTRCKTTDPRTTYIPSECRSTAAPPPPPPERPVENSDEPSLDRVNSSEAPGPRASTWSTPRELAPYAVVAALVRAMLAEGADWTYAGGEADLVEELKTRCAKARLGYDTMLLRKAVDSERVKAKRARRSA